MTYASDETGAITGQPVELYKFAVRDSTTELWYYTSSASDYVYSGDTYVATPGLRRDKVSETSDALKDELKIYMSTFHSFPQKWMYDLPSGIVDVTIYRGHGSNFVQYWRGVIKTVSPLEADYEAVILCGPVIDAVQASFRSRIYQRRCDVPLYSEDCTVDKDTYMISGILTTVSGRTVTSSLFQNQVDDYYTGGYLVSGGLKRRIKDHTQSTGTVVLLTVLPGLAAGSSFVAYPGCDHQFATCRDKYSNSINFYGCPYIPDQEPVNEDILLK